MLFLLCFTFHPPFHSILPMKKITIPAGASLKKIETLLKNEQILSSPSMFRIIVRLAGWQNALQAGEYQFSPADPLIEVIWKLKNGQTLPPAELRVTFPEGTSIYKMGVILKEKGFRDWENFQALVNEGISEPLRKRHWAIFKYIPTESLEGYLYPDTYLFLVNLSSEVVAEIMLKRFEMVVCPLWNESKNKSKMTLHEIITLASIIEKEAKEPAERPIIASVFYNRLKLGMPLAADPTIKYALERPSKKVYYDQLKINSPYNTYKRKGLPPGPICNPGLESIKAALNPAKTSYLFFVAKPDGRHIFSRDWGGHQQARGKVKAGLRQKSR